MKIRRLSEIDLARIGPLDSTEKRYRLRLLKSGRPPHTYGPLRAQLGDILNLQPEMFGSSSDPTPWETIAEAISKAAKHDDEAKFNLAVAKSLHGYAIANSVRSYRKPISAWPVGYSQSVSYWWNLYSVLEDRPCFIFADPRISNPLRREGRRFVLSLMHERIRVTDPDFAQARLVIAQFGKGESNSRTIRVFDEAQVDLFSFDQLNEMIDETYRIWIEVLQEREDQARRKPTGTKSDGLLVRTSRSGTAKRDRFLPLAPTNDPIVTPLPESNMKTRETKLRVAHAHRY